MAKIERCDGGCGKESPNDRGLHIANSWTDVRIQKREGLRKGPVRELALCEDCATRVTRALTLVATDGQPYSDNGKHL